MDLSVVIVNYNTKALLIQTLDSVFASSDTFEYEVFVVDNASMDGSSEVISVDYPEVRLISNQENVGFARANNQAIMESKGRYVLLLNSDTFIQNDTFEKMIRFLDKHPIAGAVGCKVIKPDGTLDLACKRSFPTPQNSLYHFLGLDALFPSSHRFGAYNLTYLNENENHEVDCLVGACMMVRKTVINQVGLLDESFFMYGEDIDWSYRIKKAGWEIWYVPETTIVHYKGASASKMPIRMIYEFYYSMVLYFKKHRSEDTWLGIRLLVYLGILVGFFVALGKNLLRGTRH